MAIRYEVDSFVQGHYPDKGVTANGVCSWRVARRGRRQELSVDFHNGWAFESDHHLVSAISDAELTAAIEHLRRIERGIPPKGVLRSL